MKSYKIGLKDGLPIGLGYLSVSFTFGIMAISLGLVWWQALLISILTLTSAGQLAAINIMINPGRYFEMVLSQGTINVRYSFMSISLSQNVDNKFKGIYKWLLGFFITDEIFAVASMKKNVSRIYFLGLSTLPYFGWALGTLSGALVGNIVPEVVLNALCLGIYGMFIAIVAPIAKDNKPVLVASLIAICFGVFFYYVPLIKEVPSGIAISVSAILSALICALLFPIKEDQKNE